MLFICQRNYTKGVTNSKKARQYNGQKKKNLKKRQAMIYKILHRKQKIGNYEPHKENNGGNSGTPEG
jgi:hypothetical protein